MARPSPLDELLAGSLRRPRKIRQPEWIAPMLATLTEERFSREGWIFEAKLDGVRALISRNGAGVRIVSRNRKVLNEKYPELVMALAAEGSDSLIVDGEIVTFESDVTSFTKLQGRMQIQRPSAEVRRRIPVWFYAFDLLYFDGYDLRTEPLRFRKRLLERALTFKGPLRFVVHRETECEAFYREACSRRWEGIIAKHAESKYTSGRSREWLKFKCVHEQEFVIGGYTEPAGQRIGLGALLAGYYQRGKLIYAGKVGTGFDNQTLRGLGSRLTSLETNASQFASAGVPVSGVHWVKPKLVAQIGFTEWTRDGKLRHPRFLGLRDDKNPKDVSREN